MKIKIEHTPKISYKVAKMGGIPCLGLPVLTCRDDAPCKTSGKCYAMQGKYRTQSVKKGLMNNLLAYKENPSYFFEKLAIDIMPSRYFRWFHSCTSFFGLCLQSLQAPSANLPYIRKNLQYSVSFLPFTQQMYCRNLRYNFFIPAPHFRKSPSASHFS